MCAGFFNFKCGGKEGTLLIREITLNPPRRCLNVLEIVTAEKQHNDETIIDVETFRRASSSKTSVCVETAIEVGLSDVGAAHCLRNVMLK